MKIDNELWERVLAFTKQPAPVYGGVYAAASSCSLFSCSGTCQDACTSCTGNCKETCIANCASGAGGSTGW